MSSSDSLSERAVAVDESRAPLDDDVDTAASSLSPALSAQTAQKQSSELPRQQQQQQQDQTETFSIVTTTPGEDDDTAGGAVVEGIAAVDGNAMSDGNMTETSDSSDSRHRLINDERSCSVLQEIYWFILEDNGVLAEDLTVGHILHSLQHEGIWFWRDARFVESQNVALQLAQESAGKHTGKGGSNSNSRHGHIRRQPFTNAITPQDQRRAEKTLLDWDQFIRFVTPCAGLFLKTFSEGLVIPDWSTFTTDVAYHFYAVEDQRHGTNAQYIEILRNADPDRWGLSVCSIDGQRFSIGDSSHPFSIQSCSKPVTYALCLKAEGHEGTEEWIGCEPSGRPFNSQDLMPESNKPYNASVNAGAIMAAGLFASRFSEESWREVVDRVRDTWYDLCGKDLNVDFSRETYDSEKASAYNNFAIAYNLKGRRGLPRDVDLHKMLDVYLGCCSIEMTAEALAVAAATFANGGICPITGQEVFRADVVRHVLSETMTCGMYDQSGHFAVSVGLPAKSGVSGILMVIVPNLLGFATFSPRLNSNGNSVRGLAFCKRLVNSYRIHLFEPLRAGNAGAKLDPRTNGTKDESTMVSRLAWALRMGDTYAARIRDIHLFALVLGAVSSREGLSDDALSLIHKKYQQTYQTPLDDTLLQEVVQSTRSSDRFRILEQMISGLQIVDAMRSIIFMGLLDIAVIDHSVDETERDVIVRIAVLLGVDRNVALMELHRCEQQFQAMYYDQGGRPALGRHNLPALPSTQQRMHYRSTSRGDKPVAILDLIGPVDGIQPSGYGKKLPRSSSSSVGSRKQNVRRASRSLELDLIGSGASAAEENVILKREVLRLQRKVEQLTMLLHSSRKRAMEARENHSGSMPERDDDDDDNDDQ